MKHKCSYHEAVLCRIHMSRVFLRIHNESTCRVILAWLWPCNIRKDFSSYCCDNTVRKYRALLIIKKLPFSTSSGTIIGLA